MNRTQSSVFGSRLSCTLVGLALCLGLLLLSPWIAQAQDAASEAGSAKTASDEFEPVPDPDLIVSDRVSDSIPETSLSDDGEEAEPEPEHGGIEEITVTAEKRSSNLQTTPTAITALTGAQLFDRGIYDVEQLATQVPNFQYGETFGIARITIRGVGNQGFTDPSTAFHIDGIYQNNPTAASALSAPSDRAAPTRSSPSWRPSACACACSCSTKARTWRSRSDFRNRACGERWICFVRGSPRKPLLLCR